MNTVIAIGGGGWTKGSARKINEFIVSASSRVRPKIGFIGTASFDDWQSIQRFMYNFEKSAEPSYLSTKTAKKKTKEWIEQQDIIYVGGGDTTHLLNTWKKRETDKYLIEAANSGTVMVGSSAGAMCWFETPFATENGFKFDALEGLGLVPGSCTPHYSATTYRPWFFRGAIYREQIPNGVAIDDGVAVLSKVENGVVSSMESFQFEFGMSAYNVEKRGEEVCTTTIPFTSPT